MEVVSALGCVRTRRSPSRVASGQSQAMTPLPVTIVVPARNRNTVWQAMAPTYLNQGCKELVIVDDASHPPLQPVSANAATSVRWIRLDQRVRQAEARMVGTRAATQPYVFPKKLLLSPPGFRRV